MSHECEYQYDAFEKAIGIVRAWTDETGKCTRRVFEKMGGRWYCPVHIDLVTDPAAFCENDQ